MLDAQGGLDLKGELDYALEPYTVATVPRDGLKLDLPRLPREARARLNSKASVGLERDILELYARFAVHCRSIGISEEDTQGPTSFVERCKSLRVQAEVIYAAAQKRFKIAKRLAADSHHGLPLERGIGMIVEAQGHLKDAEATLTAYNIVERLWDKCRVRVSKAVEEVLEARRLKGLVDLNINSPQVAAQMSYHSPCMGILQPFQPGCLQQRPSWPQKIFSAAEEADFQGLERQLWLTDIIYDEMYELCERGGFCVVHGLSFLTKIEKEKALLTKSQPSRERVWRVATFNRVVDCWTNSFAGRETEAHRRYILSHKKLLGAPGLPEVEGARKLLAQLIEGIFSDAGSVDSDTEDCDAGPRRTAEPANQKPHALCSPLMHAEAFDTLPLDDDSVEPSTSEHSHVADVFPVDQRGSTARSGSAVPVGERDEEFDDEELVGICVSCLVRPASQVARGCGHLVYCKPCQRRAVALALIPDQGRKGWSQKARTLSKKEFERTCISCPMCRSSTVMTAIDAFDGDVYKA